MPSKQQLAMIHVAKKDLNLSDDHYRTMLFVNFRVESSKDLNDSEVNRLMTMFRDLGWKGKSPRLPLQGGVKSPGPGAGMGKKYDNLGVRPGMATPKQLRLIEVTWANNSNVREKSPEALRRFLEHRFKISDLRFVEDRDVGKILMSVKSIKPVSTGCTGFTG